MRTDEKDIIDYLKCWPSTFVSGKEIARKSCGKRRYEQEPGWAIPILMQLVRTGVIETDQLGYFKLKLERTRKPKRHVSPQMQKILDRSGKKFDGVGEEDEIEAIVASVQAKASAARATPPAAAPTAASTQPAAPAISQPPSPPQESAAAETPPADPPPSPDPKTARAPEPVSAIAGDAPPSLKPVAA